MHPQAQEIHQEETIATASRLRYWVVGALGLWLVLDLGGRFLPVEWLHILPEHVATRRPPVHAPFMPNLRIHYDPWVGETALHANLPPQETRSAIDFSTDELGFRLTPGVAAHDKVDFLLTTGASYAYGGGLDDSETFPAVFTRDTGLKTYNGGRFWWDIQTFDELDWLLERVGNHHPTVVLLYWEDQLLIRPHLDGVPWRIDRPGERLFGKERFHSFHTAVQNARRVFGAFWSISPLEVLSIRFYKRLSNDVILPNRYAATVEQRTLPDGTRFLLLDDEIMTTFTPPTPARVNAAADYFEYYKKRLAERGCNIFVILVPNKYTLYGPQLDRDRTWLPDPYVDRLEKEMVRRDIPVLNGLSVLKPYAAADLASGQLSFYREDHHWSALGVRRISAAAARALQSAITQGENRTSAVQ